MEFKPVLVTNKQLLSSVEVSNGQFLVINDTQELYVDYDGSRQSLSPIVFDFDIGHNVKGVKNLVIAFKYNIKGNLKVLL